MGGAKKNAKTHPRRSVKHPALKRSQTPSVMDSMAVQKSPKPLKRQLYKRHIVPLPVLFTPHPGPVANTVWYCLSMQLFNKQTNKKKKKATKLQLPIHTCLYSVKKKKKKKKMRLTNNYICSRCFGLNVHLFLDVTSSCHCQVLEINELLVHFHLSINKKKIIMQIIQVQN